MPIIALLVGLYALSYLFLKPKNTKTVNYIKEGN